MSAQLNPLMTDPSFLPTQVPIDFAQHRFDDAEIIGFTSSATDLVVDYQDWQEQRHKIIFKDTLGYEAHNPEGMSLSHGVALDNDPLIDTACKAAGDIEPQAFRVFSFVSAWTNIGILRVVAKEVWIVI